MSRFYFVAGEQVTSAESCSVLDAWMKIESRARREPIASEFRELPIAAHDDSGRVLATRTWSGWHDAVLRDTYGDNFRGVLAHAAELLQTDGLEHTMTDDAFSGGFAANH